MTKKVWFVTGAGRGMGVDIANAAFTLEEFRGGEGWMDLTPEVPPFGIRTMLIEPGSLRTELPTPESMKYA
jgi:hypothetical protein